MNVYLRPIGIFALILPALLSMALTGCQRGTPFKADNYSAQFRQPHETGFTNFQDQKYTVDGDAIRTDERTREMLQFKPETTHSPEEAEQKQIALATSIQKVSVVRYDSENKPTALGGQSFLVQVLSQLPETGLEPIEFRGKLEQRNNSLILQKTQVQSGQYLYTLSGFFTDDTDKFKSKGELYITQFVNKNGELKEEAKTTITLRSYLADIRIKTSEELDPKSNLAKRVKDLEQKSLAWVNNSVVILGRSFYEYQIIRLPSEQAAIKDAEPIFGFKGESVSDTQLIETPVEEVSFPKEPKTQEEVNSPKAQEPTTEQPKTQEPKTEQPKKSHQPNQSSTESKESQSTKVIAPFGSNNNGIRSFEIELTDPDDPKEKTDILMTIRERNPEPEPEVSDDDTSHSLPERKPGVPSESLPDLLGYNSDAFLNVTYDPSRLPMTAQVMKDLDQNYHIRDIRTLNFDSEMTNKVRNNSKNFWKYAHPFRKMLQDIYEYYDVPAPLAYVSVFESAFFQGSYVNYLAVRPGGTDTGPFQILKGTGLHLKMKIDNTQAKSKKPKNWDERLYFFSAACGAASYMKELSEDFIHSDATLAILAYNQGPTGAASHLNRDLGWGETSNLLAKVKKYRFTYAELREQSNKNAKHIEYVDSKLAAYFLLQAPSVMGFTPPSDVMTTYPSDTKVIPKDIIKTPGCEDIAKKYRGKI